ncbi:hypothetical protein VPH35_015502 [Triticum aestivum]
MLEAGHSGAACRPRTAAGLHRPRLLGTPPLKPAVARRSTSGPFGRINLWASPTCHSWWSGAKMAKYTLCFGSAGGTDQTMENPLFRGPGCSSSPVLKTLGSSKRVVA